MESLLDARTGGRDRDAIQERDHRERNEKQEYPAALRQGTRISAPVTDRQARLPLNL
jgi:hypothetical protein